MRRSENRLSVRLPFRFRWEKYDDAAGLATSPGRGPSDTINVFSP